MLFHIILTLYYETFVRLFNMKCMNILVNLWAEKSIRPLYIKVSKVGTIINIIHEKFE